MTAVIRHVNVSWNNLLKMVEKVTRYHSHALEQPEIYIRLFFPEKGALTVTRISQLGHALLLK